METDRYDKCLVFVQDMSTTTMPLEIHNSTVKICQLYCHRQTRLYNLQWRAQQGCLIQTVEQRDERLNGLQECA